MLNQRWLPAERRETYIGAAMLAFMALTRSHHFGAALKVILTGSNHFGSYLSLPDASWAMFFLAGLWTRSLLWPLLMMSTAFIVDYLVIAGGVSSYCFTPGYLFLIPTHLALWGAGRWASFDTGLKGMQLVRTAVALAVGCSAAFVISNVGFYWLSGYFANMSAFNFADAVIRYLPSYLLVAGLYTAIAFAGWYVRDVIHAAIQSQRHGR
jgi:hypothetical protein